MRGRDAEAVEVELPPSSDKRARFSVVLSFRELVLCVSTVRFRKPSRLMYAITPATTTNATRTRTTRRKGLIGILRPSVCARTTPPACVLSRALERFLAARQLNTDRRYDQSGASAVMSLAEAAAPGSPSVSIFRAGMKGVQLRAQGCHPDWPQFMRGCIRYRQSLDEQLPDAPRTTGEFNK